MQRVDGPDLLLDAFDVGLQTLTMRFDENLLLVEDGLVGLRRAERGRDRCLVDAGDQRLNERLSRSIVDERLIVDRRGELSRIVREFLQQFHAQLQVRTEIGETSVFENLQEQGILTFALRQHVAHVDTRTFEEIAHVTFVVVDEQLQLLKNEKEERVVLPVLE